MLNSRSFLIVTLVSSLLIGGAALTRSVAPLFSAQEKELTMNDISRDECPNKIENYRNSVNWYRGPNRITVHAKSACGSKYGEEYDLHDVTVEIRSGHQLITSTHAQEGTFWPGTHEMLISKSDSAADSLSARKNLKNRENKAAVCLSEFNLLQIDLKTGEMKTPGMQAVLNSADEIKCHLNKRLGFRVAAASF